MVNLKKYRLWCDTENQHKYVWKEESDPVPTTCPDDTGHSINESKTTIVNTRDTQEVKVVDQLLGEGSNKRLKYKGYEFTAPSGVITDFDFQTHWDCNIQGGFFPAKNAEEGDMIEMILIPGVPGYEYKYVETLYLENGAEYDIMEEFSVSDLLPSGTPMRLTYDNTGGTKDKNITFAILYRL